MTAEQEFLAGAGWSKFHRHDFPADWSTRTFSRLTRAGGSTAILMQSVPDSDPRALAGHKIKDFILLSKYLRESGVHAPEIYAADEANGFLLVEDFGDYSLHHAFENNAPELGEYYAGAADILLNLREKTVRNAPEQTPLYFESHVYKGRRRLWDWYLPVMLQKPNDSAGEECLNILAGIENNIPPMNPVFLHGDFHPHNLMILKNGEIGVLDFQGGMSGPAPYDLVNLLLDARRIVPDEIKQAIITKFKNSMSADEWKIFEMHYALRSFDFHARVIGQAIKLGLNGKPKLLSYLPYLEEYLRKDLAHPLLAPLREFMVKHGQDVAINFTPDRLKNAKHYIKPDAF